MIPDLCNSPGRCAYGFDLRAQHPQLCTCSDSDEWSIFVSALRAASRRGRILQSAVRPLIRGRIEPKHIGTLYRRAKAEGLIAEADAVRSDDIEGKNAGRWEPTYEWRAAA